MSDPWPSTRTSDWLLNDVRRAPRPDGEHCRLQDGPFWLKGSLSLSALVLTKEHAKHTRALPTRRRTWTARESHPVRQRKSENGGAGSDATRPADPGGSPAAGASSAHHSAACATAPGLASKKSSIKPQNPEPPFSPQKRGIPPTLRCSAPCRGRGEAETCAVGGLREARGDEAASEHCSTPLGAG
jgi:hypothetical protein